MNNLEVWKWKCANNNSFNNRLVSRPTFHRFYNVLLLQEWWWCNKGLCHNNRCYNAIWLGHRHAAFNKIYWMIAYNLKGLNVTASRHLLTEPIIMKKDNNSLRTLKMLRKLKNIVKNIIVKEHQRKSLEIWYH
jgi:hypothetical protein